MLGPKQGLELAWTLDRGRARLLGNRSRPCVQAVGAPRMQGSALAWTPDRGRPLACSVNTVLVDPEATGPCSHSQRAKPGYLRPGARGRGLVRGADGVCVLEAPSGRAGVDGVRGRGVKKDPSGKRNIILISCISALPTHTTEPGTQSGKDKL